MKTALQLSFGSVEISAQELHPNKMRFRGVLVRLDEASTKPPNGSNGHRILVPSDVAKRRLGTLINMGLNYSPTLDGHAQRRKVGVITKAWIDGQDLKVEGTVWKHDFPEAEKDLKRPNLGMSMELGDVDVEDPNAQIWKLTDFHFLGATILDRNAAAYYKTAAIAAKADSERSNMAVKTKTAKKPVANVKQDLDGAQIAEIAANAAAAAVTKTMTGVINRQTEIMAQFSGRLEELELGNLDAATSEEDDEEAQGMTVPMMRTKKKVAARKSEDEEDEEAAAEEDEEAAHQEPDGDEDDGEDDDDEDDMESMSSGVDKGSLKDTGPDTSDPGDDDPGHLSEDAKNKGSKTSSEDKVGSNVNKAVTGSALAVLRKQVKKLAAGYKALQAENGSLKSQLKTMKKQVSAAAERVERRSVPAEVLGLLNKANIDSRDLLASGTQLSISEVDGILASVPNLDVVTRMTLKNKFRQAGLMEDGQVNRGVAR